jgi:hypothetical protein
MEQTSVNILVEKLKSTRKKYMGMRNIGIDYHKEIKEANENFKQHIIDAYNEGSMSIVKDAEKYYNEKFNK